jgi:hypothetical protein
MQKQFVLSFGDVIGLVSGMPPNERRRSGRHTCHMESHRALAQSFISPH